MASLLTQSKIQVLKMIYKALHNLALTSLTSSSAKFSLFLHSLYPDILASLLMLTGQKLSCLRAWAHAIPRDWILLPRHLHVTPSGTPGRTVKDLFLTLLFQTQPNLHLNSLSSFPALLFSTALLVIKWPTIYLLVYYLSSSSWNICSMKAGILSTDWLIPSIKNST